MEQEKQAALQAQQQQSMVDQAGAMVNAPLADPSKNPALGRSLNDGYDQLNCNNETIPPDQGETEEDFTPEGL